MKKIKSILMFSAIAAAFTLTSCDDDDDKKVSGPSPKSDFVEKKGEITADEKWTADNTYLLDGRVTVTNGATLTIEPGTVIKANPGGGAIASSLLISREGKIMANGTPSQPIIFTTIADDVQSGEIASPNMDTDNNGLWGGIIILGKAPISASSNEVQIEGIPTSDQNGLYGGTNAAHNSGELSYVSIRHAGTNIAPGNELNGLTLGAVGNGTKIHHIEVVANQDDGIEWFGGTVSVENVLIWNCGDDGLDTDQDWIGTCDNFVIITPRGGSAFELDGPEGSGGATGTHFFKNGTVYAGSEIDHLVDWDASTNAALQNVYFYGLEAGYAATADFAPFESFGGDMSGTTSGIEITINGGTLADLFEGGVVPNGVTEVAEDANTVGANTGEFAGWTWAADSGELNSIGQ